MKKTLLPLCALVASHCAFPHSALAAVQWSEEYQGYQMLELPWTQVQKGRMSTAPGETWLEIKGSLGDTYAQIDAPDFAPETQSTLQFTLNITKKGATGAWSQAAMIFLDGYAWEIKIDTDRVTVAGSVTRQYTAPIGLDVTHQYHFVINDGVASLYIDSLLIGDLQDIGGSKAYPTLSQVLRFGDYGSNMSGDGRWDDVKWHNTEVVPVPEPGAVALLLGGGIAFVGRLALKRRRQR